MRAGSKAEVIGLCQILEAAGQGTCEVHQLFEAAPAGRADSAPAARSPGYGQVAVRVRARRWAMVLYVPTGPSVPPVASAGRKTTSR